MLITTFSSGTSATWNVLMQMGGLAWQVLGQAKHGWPSYGGPGTLRLMNLDELRQPTG